MLTDTHAHIYMAPFEPDREEVIQRALSQGVTKIYMPNVDSSTISAMLHVESTFSACHAMMGLHPCSVKDNYKEELQIVKDQLKMRSYCAIGEIGTDLYWDKTYWPQQQDAFCTQLEWARQYDIPVVIHCRQSLDETIDMLEAQSSHSLTGIFHCFTGSWEQAKRIIDLNFYLGIGGISTFNNTAFSETIHRLPLDRIVLETDSPYLAPVPWRGKRNEPGYLPLILRRISDLKKIHLSEASRLISMNVSKIFRLSDDEI